MKMLVKIIEYRPTEFTYYVEADNIAAAKTKAKECYDTHEQSDECYLYRTVPRRIYTKCDSVEVTEA